MYSFGGLWGQTPYRVTAHGFETVDNVGSVCLSPTHLDLAWIFSFAG